MLTTSEVFTLLRSNTDLSRAYGKVNNVELETATRSTRFWIAQTQNGYIMELATDAKDRIVDLQTKKIPQSSFRYAY